MGELRNLGGNLYEYKINDFRNGIVALGPGGAATAFGTVDTQDTMLSITNMTAYSGALEPITGDVKYNTTAITGATASVDYMFPYFKPDANGMSLLVGKGGQLYEHPTSGASTTVTTLVTLTNSGTTRYGAQGLGYNWISGSSLTLLRYNFANPGGLGKLGYAGTKSPTNAPTMALVSATAFQTTNTVYKYRYAWEYGTGRELGMGWKESSTSITFLGAANGISVTMDANPPSNYAHATARALFRNVTSLTTTFFLITRTAYSGSSLATSFLDTVSDATIELAEETDPVFGETITAPVYSELLPPAMTYVATHEGRLWGLDIWKEGTRYPHTVVHSRIAGLAPHFDQFEGAATLQAIDASAGDPMGLMTWMGNLYAFFRRGISALSIDPAPGRAPAFTQIVYGQGCVNAKTLCVTPEGIVFQSQRGLVLFNGGPNPVPYSDRLISKIAGSSFNGAGYVPKTREFRLATTAYNTFVKCTQNDYWYTCDDFSIANNNWSYSCQAGDDLVYGLATGVTEHVYKANQASTYGNGIDAVQLSRGLVFNDLHFGFPEKSKFLKDIEVTFTRKIIPKASTSYIGVTWKNDTLVSTGITQSFFPAVEAKTFRFGFNPAGATFLGSNFMALSFLLSMPSGDNTDSNLKQTPIESITFHFTMDPNQNAVVGVA